MRRIHHVGIVVRSLAQAYGFWRDTLGLPVVREAEIADQGVRAALLGAGDSEIELLEPVAADTGVARFLATRGEGVKPEHIDSTVAQSRAVASLREHPYTPRLRAVTVPALCVGGGQGMAIVVERLT